MKKESGPYIHGDDCNVGSVGLLSRTGHVVPYLKPTPWHRQDPPGDCLNKQMIYDTIITFP